MTVYIRTLILIFRINDNGVRIVNFATSKLVVRVFTFSHQNIHKCTWTSPDGKIHNQMDHILIDRRCHLVILDVLYVRGLTVILITIQ
jgi:hypothetical protein